MAYTNSIHRGLYRASVALMHAADMHRLPSDRPSTRAFRALDFSRKVLDDTRYAAAALDAYHRSPNGSIVGLAREALRLEDDRIEMAKIQVASDYIRSRIGNREPQVILTLGSGLGQLAGQIKNPVVIPYDEIPCYAHPFDGVPGHACQLLVGELGGKMVAAMQGRFHLYQGVTARDAVRPLRSLVLLGAKTFIVTNAAGYINPDFKAGDLMLIGDQINFMYQNPLTGPNLGEFGTRFPSMSSPYDTELWEIADEAAKSIGITLRRGTYIANLGPPYESPAQNRALRILGGDAVGMSTVPEVEGANHARNKFGLKVLGITLLTNAGTGVIPGKKLEHEEVTAAGKAAEAYFGRLIRGILEHPKFA